MVVGSELTTGATVGVAPHLNRTAGRRIIQVIARRGAGGAPDAQQTREDASSAIKVADHHGENRAQGCLGHGADSLDQPGPVDRFGLVDHD